MKTEEALTAPAHLLAAAGNGRRIVSMHSAVTFCKSVVGGKSRGVNAAWCRGFLSGAGCSGHVVVRRSVTPLEWTAFQDGRSFGKATAKRFR